MNVRIDSISLINEILLNMAETVEENYRIENGKLVQFHYHCRIPDWNQQNRMERVAALNTVLANGGQVITARVDNKVVGMASLKNEYHAKNRMQLFSLHIDKNFRKMGIGKTLFLEVEKIAKSKDAAGLYISAAPKKNTIDFYLKMGATITDEIEKVLFDEEPEDIQMEKMWKI